MPEPLAVEEKDFKNVFERVERERKGGNEQKSLVYFPLPSFLDSDLDQYS